MRPAEEFPLSIMKSAADLSRLANLVVQLGREGIDFRAKAARLAMVGRPDLRPFLQPLMAELEASELEEEVSDCYRQLASAEQESREATETLQRLRNLQELQARQLLERFEANLPLRPGALDNAMERADALLARYNV
jgi:hypothetical protein